MPRVPRWGVLGSKWEQRLLGRLHWSLETPGWTGAPHGHTPAGTQTARG